MQNDLISRSDAIKRAKAAEIKMESINGIKAVPMDSVAQFLSILPAVDAVEVDKAMVWLEGYTMTDTEQIYSNGTVYVPLFRVKQAFVDKAYNGLREG